MRLSLYLVLAYCSVCVNSTNNGRKRLVKAYINDSSERQFIGHIRKWIFGRGNEKELSKTKTRTEIKYLPIYVPVPVYSDTKVPDSEAYGAHQQNNKDVELEENEMIVQAANKPGFPYAHTQNYNLPFGSQVYQVTNRQTHPWYYMPHGEQLTRPAQTNYQFYPHSPYYGAYEYVNGNSYNPLTDNQADPNDYDSEVIENPELVTDPNSDSNEELYTRKRKKYRTSRN